MRPSHFALAPVLLLAPFLLLGAVLPGALLAQTRAECEYRNPDHPNWNYARACTVGSVEAGDRTTTTARVDNGSTLTIVEEGTDGALRFVVNGHAATRLEGGASLCFLTTEDEETICIHGGGEATSEAASPAPEASPPEAAPPETPPVTPAAAIGGGEPGHCLSWVTDDDREGLIEKGACDRRTNCAEIEGESGMSCLIDITWTSGRETVITRQGGVYTLDGAVAVPDEQGCLTDEGVGLHFCFSQAEMTAQTYPALALPPAPAPETVAAAGAPEAAPAITGNRCSFLRDEVEVSSWPCTETVSCEGPVCTVSYVFENGTNVVLDTADGQVMLMNGAKADSADWAEGAVVNVTRPGAPYTFRFTPQAVAASTE